MSSTRFPANLVPPRRVLLSLLMATALTGCATTPFVARAPDLANSFSVAAPARTAQAPWFQSFQDRRLDELILRALARNLSIQEALAVIDEAEAGTQLARASDFPTLRAGGAAVRGDPDAIGRVSDSTSATLSTSWMLDLFGANRANRAAAVAELEAAQISEEVARRAVTAAVSSAYIDLRFFQESIALTRQSVASRKETLDLTRSMLELGQANRLDVLQAEQAVAQAEANLPSLQIGFDQSLNRLATLTASRTAELRPMLQRGSAQPVARFRPSVGVPAEVIRARPDVQVAERQLASAAARIGVAEAAFWPSVTLSGTITPTDIKGGGSLTSWSIGPQISLPIFTGGANKARLKAAEARAQQAETRWRASVLDAIEEVENGLSAYNRGAANVVAQRRLVASAQETVSLAREIYRSGQSTFFTVLDAERNLLSARAALASAVRDHAAGYVAVSVAAAAPLG
ncbi:efflux transporter outer membrane subunit [Seohaeicola zhoushanensis]|nr:efflux transporter outer membrane subunit [Seohaeicola zhoushanensis]